MSRIACILVPGFPLAALLRANPEFDNAALIISQSQAAHAEILFVSERAHKLGVRTGMTLAQARSIAPELTAALRSDAAEDSAHAALLDAAESVSPLAEAGERGRVWLDLAGLGRMHESEDALAAELAGRVRRVGLEAAVGIASNREIAHLAAHCGGMRVIAPEREREFLDWLPLDLLGLDDDLAAMLARWGLKRLGELARLKPEALGGRLGRRGVELARIARGGASRPLQPQRRAEVFAESIELEYGVETLEPLAFIMRAMLERLIARLELRGLAAGELVLTLGLAAHRRDSRRIALAAPTNDIRAILTLISLSLEASPPNDAIDSIQIGISPREPRPAQTDMFLPPTPAPDRLETAIARLAALCGPENVGALWPDNSHRPEALRLDSFAPPPARASAHSDASARHMTQLVIRAIRPAMEVEVMISRGMPEFVRGSNLGGRVVSLAGPWRRDGEWWRERGGFARDYYELALDDGRVYRAFRELRSERWYIDGLFD